MPDATELTKAIKKAASKAIKAEKPVEVCFGKVTSASPLQILVDQKFTLGAAQLVLTRNVTDFKAMITGGNIQNYYYVGTPPNASTVPVDPSHRHAIGKIEITVHNGLVVGDEVILIRQQDGQKYVVVDKIG
ncbi:MAG: Protein of unknown function (DUF2577) [Bacteriophage sp.]|nr:MAG: Protein of unknown function (DUF2577) [Bacteriophage sp.]UVY21705.1 MAG: Protein of unknown function (DUF2577) [Bacteriophage sp.]UVY22539.1 MAG: Protein of unknown function (DUF2577) [Bacteriophage sp.]UVY34355.1 MAG: Protein of unknown function (DUF2577) [Bacteriophage sp.]UWD73584.1 MAG: Protein of unknown function (DUF2577) [Bacteriophage sp.]